MKIGRRDGDMDSHDGIRRELTRSVWEKLWDIRNVKDGIGDGDMITW